MYSSYLGGTNSNSDNGNEVGRAIAVDTAGRAYVVGYTNSPDFPQVNPLPLGGNAGPWDAFVTRFDAAGCAIGYSTLLGGSNTDDAFGLTVDSTGNLYVVGDTASGDFPTFGGVQSTHRGGIARPYGGRESDAFITKLAPSTTDTALSRCDTRGKKVTDPVLPTQTQRTPTQPPIFRFFDFSALWFDPPIATGYKYTMTGTALFTAVLDFPTGVDADNRFTVSVDGVVLGDFGPGQPARFSQYAAQLGARLVGGVGVRSFNISNIAPALETEDPKAFPVQLEFDLPRGDFSMQATTAAAPATPATITFAPAARRVLRGSGYAILSLTRGGDTTTAVSATYATSPGTATAGSDYTAATGTVSFDAGQTSATVGIPVAAGTGNATNETFTVMLSSPSTGAALGAASSAVVTLLDGSAVFTQYFAEGATGALFDTRLALLNPGGTPAEVLMTFQRADSAVFTSSLTLAAGARATVRPATLADLAQAEFSTRIDADARIVADRAMQWDGTGYGSHAEASVASPATTWYFAEGATMGEFDLFYLLQNPGATASTVEVTYLLPAPSAPIVKTYAVPARQSLHHLGGPGGCAPRRGGSRRDGAGRVGQPDHRGALDVPQRQRHPLRRGPQQRGRHGASPVVVPGRGRDRGVLRPLRAARQPRRRRCVGGCPVPAAERDHRVAQLRGDGAEPQQHLGRSRGPAVGRHGRLDHRRIDQRRADHRRARDVVARQRRRRGTRRIRVRVRRRWAPGGPRRRARWAAARTSRPTCCSRTPRTSRGRRA